MYEVTEKILREVRKVIVGKDDVVEKVWISILAQGHVLLEDVPGVGKTTMALAFSKALGLETSVCSSHRTPCPRISSAFPCRSRGGWCISPVR